MAAFLATTSVAPVYATESALEEDVFSDSAEDEFGSEAATAEVEFADEIV